MKKQKYIPEIFTKTSGSEDSDDGNNGKEAFESLHVKLSPDQALQNKLTDYIEESREKWKNLFNIVSHLKKAITEQIKTTLKGQISEISQDVSETHEKVDFLIDRVSELEEKNVSRDLFEAQNKQLSRLQENAEFKDRKSAIMKLISLHDSMEQSNDSKTEAWNEILLEALESLQVRRIEKFPDEYNPDFQKAIDTEEVDSQEKETQVLEIVHEGFKYKEDRIVRPQLVVISKFHNKEEVDKK